MIKKRPKQKLKLILGRICLRRFPGCTLAVASSGCNEKVALLPTHCHKTMYLNLKGTGFKSLRNGLWPQRNSLHILWWRTCREITNIYRFVLVFKLIFWNPPNTNPVLQKQLRESLDNQRLRTEEHVSSIRRGKDTMETIKVSCFRGKDGAT